MQITPITTRPLMPPRDDLFAVLDAAVPLLRNGDILCVTSKVVAIHQGRTVAIEVGDTTEKDALVARIADMALPRDMAPHGHVKHTITDGNLASSAGVDASNGNDYYILWPEDSSAVAREIAEHFTQRDHITQLGVVITDSRSMPLRYGAIGFAIGAYGITPLNNYAGTPDLFDRPLKVEQANVIDALAAAAVLAMGEGNECTPLCLIHDAPHVHFDPHAVFEDMKVPLHEDIYYPFLKLFEEYAERSK